MKSRFPIWLSVLISLLLLAFGLIYGNVSGYTDERTHADALLTGDSGLLTVVGYRASDALNLCVVAERHLAGDADVAALRTDAEALRKSGLSPAAVKSGDAALAEAFGTVAAKLKADAGFTQSTRDPQYLEMLTADFEEYGQSAIYDTYNKAAAEFNEKLSTPVLGDVARFFGVKPCELYE